MNVEMENSLQFSRDILKIGDIEQIVNKICLKLNTDVTKVLERRGGIVGISGGIDSSVTLALATKALGAENVIGIILPERDSSPESRILAQALADKFGVKTVVEDISPVLNGFRCYERRDEAVKRVIPDFNPQKDKMKIVVNADSVQRNLPPVFFLKVIFSDGSEERKRLPINEFFQIVAASNLKQRTRMSFLYYYAENHHYAVIGTPNIHEVKQGFFVKYGDGGADVMPISKLYKSQVYQLADYLGIPLEIIQRTPTTDTYSAEQTQEEFFYQLPFEEMDLLWYGWEKGFPAVDIAIALGISEELVLSHFKNFKRKQRTTDYLRMPPIGDYDFFNVTVPAYKI